MLGGGSLYAQQTPCQCGLEDGYYSQAAISMDGNMDDWGLVLNDPDNVICDGSGSNDDRDRPIQSTGRDIKSFGYTWDQTYLYGYIDREASDTNNDKLIFYIDADNDNYMSTGEPVVIVFWHGNNQSIDVYIGSYTASNNHHSNRPHHYSSGDPLYDSNGKADGYTMPGEINVAPPGHPDYSGKWGSNDGLSMEWRVRWRDLGLNATSHISWHVSSTNSQPRSHNISNQIDDNLGGCGDHQNDDRNHIEFTGSTNQIVYAGKTYYLPHTISNHGDHHVTLDLESDTNGDFSLEDISYYKDLGTQGVYEPGTDVLLTDHNNDNLPDLEHLSDDETVHLLIKVEISQPPLDGNVELKTTATQMDDDEWNRDVDGNNHHDDHHPSSYDDSNTPASVTDLLSVKHKIEGTVWSDNNHNGVLNSRENGFPNVTMVLHNISKGTCRSVYTDEQGNYVFDEVTNGSYSLTESYGETVPVPQHCPAAEKDPNGYLSTTDNQLTFSVNGTNLNQKNFGDYHGSKITGTSFNDQGANSGTANDGIQNGGEAGIGNVRILLEDANSSANYTETQTDGNGNFKIWIPYSATGKALKIVEVNPETYLSTGAQFDNLSRTSAYDRIEDAISFNPESGTAYSGVKFGNVKINSFLGEEELNASPGTEVFFSHSYKVKTDGTVSFTLSNSDDPDHNGWSQTIYEDKNCNGKLSSGENAIDAPLDIDAGEKVCILIKSYVPSNIAQSTHTIEVHATFNYRNASPDMINELIRSDEITVSNPSEKEGLKINKSVDKESAFPGADLTYSITYTNNSDKPITQLEITDSTPAYTVFKTAGCSSTPDKLTNCSIESPNDGEKGTVKWSFSGSLSPGSSGTVTYKVEIEQ